MESCYEIVPMLDRYANHGEMSDTELARVRMHLIDCDRCRAEAIPEHRKLFEDLWPAERAAPRTPKAGKGLLGGAVIGSVLLHVAAAAAVVFFLGRAQSDGILVTDFSRQLSAQLDPASASAEGAGASHLSIPSEVSTNGGTVKPAANAAQASLFADTPALIQITQTPEYQSRLVIDPSTDPHLFQAGGTSLPLRREIPLQNTTLAAGDLDPFHSIVRGSTHASNRVILLVDRTPSMHARRNEIVQRITRWHQALSKQDKAEMQMTVVSFGEKPTRELVGFTESLDELVDAVRRIEPATSEVENTAAGLNYCMGLPAGGRAAHIVLFTDERGDDLDDATLLQTLRKLRRDRVKLYVVCDENPMGVASRAGRAAAGPIRLLVGRESARPESLCDWGQAIPVLKPGSIPSGFGPYALSLLAVKSNGQIFLTQLSVDNNIDDLNSCRPALDSRAQYDKNNRAQPLRLAVLDGVRAMAAVRFPRRTRMTSDKQRLEELARTRSALQAVRKQAPRMARAMEQHYADEKERRWQANARLLVAQLAAADYYLSIRLELLEAAKPLAKGEVVTITLKQTDAPAAPAGLSDAARRLRAYGATPWTTLGALLGDLKTLHLKRSASSQGHP